MTFKEGNKLFWIQFPIFFVIGLILLSGFWFFGDDTKAFLQDSFFEHFAINSIVLIFLLCMLTSGLFLIAIGRADLQKTSHRVIYNYVVRPPIELGITLSSVAFSLSTSLVVVLLIDRNFGQAAGLAIGLSYIIGIASVYWFMSAIILDNKYLSTRKEQVGTGLVLVLGVPLLSWLVIPTMM